MEELTRLHLGCGQVTPASWINIDGSWNARLARFPLVRRALGLVHLIPSSVAEVAWNSRVLYHDLRKPLPFVNNVASVIYTSHTLEHLYAADAQQLVSECFRVLVPGGILRVVVPDLRSIVLEYLGQMTLDENDGGQSTPADRLNQRLLMRPWAKPSGNFVYRLYSSTQDFHSHKWMYDADSMSRRLTGAGFVDVGEKQFLQTRIAGLDDVEKADRVLNGAGICIEANKPHVGNA